jgi:hypothetical protein
MVPFSQELSPLTTAKEGRLAINIFDKILMGYSFNSGIRL